MIWEQSNIGVSYNGYMPLPVSGRVRLVQIYWGSKRNDPKPWKLRTFLPGWSDEREFATVEEAKASARRILASFVKTATAALESEE